MGETIKLSQFLFYINRIANNSVGDPDIYLSFNKEFIPFKKIVFETNKDNDNEILKIYFTDEVKVEEENKEAAEEIKK